jgi:hypothetical protein
MIWDSVIYVTSAFMFWQSMMMTAFCGTLIGMVLHNGDVKGARKSAIAILPLVLMVSTVSYLRVSPNIIGGIETTKTYAGTLTALFVAASYVSGFFFGVWLLRKNHHHKV